MKCPLVSIGWAANAGTLPKGGVECIQEECGWWSVRYGQCAILALEKIAEQLKQINSKMKVGR